MSRLPDGPWKDAAEDGRVSRRLVLGLLGSGAAALATTFKLGSAIPGSLQSADAGAESSTYSYGGTPVTATYGYGGTPVDRSSSTTENPPSGSETTTSRSGDTATEDGTSTPIPDSTESGGSHGGGGGGGGGGTTGNGGSPASPTTTPTTPQSDTQSPTASPTPTSTSTEGPTPTPTPTSTSSESMEFGYQGYGEYGYGGVAA